MTDRSRTMLVLGALLAAGLVVRLLAHGLDGHGGDVSVMHRWAERMASVGPIGFYDGSGSIYPVMLYPLWALGAALDGEALDRAIKGLSIPFDLALGALLFAMVRRTAGTGPATLVAALYLFNPSMLLAGPVWGQVDAAGTLPFVGALLAVARRRYAAAGALGMVALLVKPQFGFVLLPVLAAATLRSRRAGEGWWRSPPARVAAGIGVAYVVVAGPLLLDPIRYVGLLLGVASLQPSTSLNAFNPWGLLLGFDVPDDGYAVVGALLLAGGLGLSLLPLARQRDLRSILAAAALVVFAVYVLPTRVHERYLFPAFAVLAPIAVRGRAELAAYVALSIGFAGSLVYALLATTSFRIPSPFAGWVLGDAGVWTIGAIVLGAIGWWVWLVALRRRRRLGHAGGRAA